MPVMTKAGTYEHGPFIVWFTCSCGREHVANFTEAEHLDCACGRRHWPIVSIVSAHAKELT